MITDNNKDARIFIITNVDDTLWYYGCYSTEARASEVYELLYRENPNIYRFLCSYNDIKDGLAINNLPLWFK